MATTHVVSLFLPYTINFQESTQHERRPSPPTRNHSRNVSTNELTTRMSTASLLTTATPPRTPGTGDIEDIFSQLGPESAALHFAKPQDPHSLVRSDIHLPEWDRQAVFNQPQSRAGLMPSGSILEFQNACEEVQRQRQNKSHGPRNTTSPPSSGRSGSAERFANSIWSVVPAVQGNGGLTNAIREVSSTGEFDITWVGTVGFPTDSIPENLKGDISDKLLHEYQASTVFVNDKDFDGHYAHFCKIILWPIFHYQVPDHPKSKAYADHSWEFYRNLNQKFADTVIASYKQGDIIWVHDYHLLLVPAMIRGKIPDAQIGFFLHTAFPSSEVFKCLAMRKQLLEGMLGANLVAFQTEEYAQHFLQTCSRLLTVETVAEGVQLEDHFVNVTSCPIGLNPELTQEWRESADVKEWVDALKEKYKGKKVIVARDKLDNIRGVRQKLLAYELFLNKYPEWRDKVVMIQVATSTSEQSELLTTVSDIVTRIDSVHSTLAHQPLIFLKQDIGFAQYIALLTIADVMMITALRDGMNLQAHEFVFCQDGKGSHKKYGPLILSEFTGSAVVFGKSHLSINPWDYQQQAKAIRQALEMSVEEKQKRWSRLHKVVTTDTGAKWTRELAKALEKVHEEHGARNSTAVPRLSIPLVMEAYKNASRRVFILDYEGTLAPHRTQAGSPLPSPQRVFDGLNDLVSDPKNIVYVMSGRTQGDLESDFRTVRNIGLIAENGCFIRTVGQKKWTGFPDMDAMSMWKSAVKGILQYYYERLDGSYIEERDCSLLYRFDKVLDKEATARTAGECADHINGACNKMRVRAVPIHNAILIESLDWSKKSAAAYILEQRRKANQEEGIPPADFLFVAGDDREDEVIFRWANELGKRQEVAEIFTVSVGKRNTEATSTLTQGTTGLLSVLGKLAKMSLDAAPRDYFNLKSGRK